MRIAAHAVVLGLAAVIALSCSSRESGPFACGGVMCDSASQYCSAPVGGSASCKTLPASCADVPTCTCMSGALGVSLDECYCDLVYGCTISPGAGAGGGDAGASDAGDGG